MRFVELSDERVAVVYSVDEKVKWTRRNRTFGSLVEKGAKLDSYSLAIDAFKGKKLPARPETVETTGRHAHAGQGEMALSKGEVQPLQRPKKRDDDYVREERVANSARMKRTT